MKKTGIPKGWYCRHSMQKRYPDGTHVCIFCGAMGMGPIPDPTSEMKMTIRRKTKEESGENLS